MTDVGFADNQVLLLNTPAQVESLLHDLKQAAKDIGFYVNTDKRGFMYLKQDEAIFTLSSKPLKWVDQFSSNISFTDSDANICIGKAWTDIDRLLITWESDLFDKIKQDFFQVVCVGTTEWLHHLNSNKMLGEKAG